jgi:transcription antitermination factor NusG
MIRWYLAKSKPRKEQLLIESFSRWDVETYYPMVRERGRPGARLEPLFNTYIFCRFESTDPKWQAIRWAPGLSYFLKEADQLAVVNDSLVDYVKEKTRRWNEGALGARFKRGDSVSIVDGPMAGFEAVFSGYLSTQERCLVLLKSVTGISSVELSQMDIEPANGAWRGRLGLEPG